MKATDFECRHQTLVHQLIVGAAFLTYLIDREDVVWRFVKDSATPSLVGYRPGKNDSWDNPVDRLNEERNCKKSGSPR